MKRGFPLYLDEEIIKNIERKCKAKQRSVSWFVNKVLSKLSEKEIEVLLK